MLVSTVKLDRGTLRRSIKINGCKAWSYVSAVPRRNRYTDTQPATWDYECHRFAITVGDDHPNIRVMSGTHNTLYSDDLDLLGVSRMAFGILAQPTGGRTQRERVRRPLACASVDIFVRTRRRPTARSVSELVVPKPRPYSSSLRTLRSLQILIITRVVDSVN